MTTPRDPVADLRRIAYLLERAHEPTYRVRAFRRAAASAAGAADLDRRAAAGTLRELDGVGEVTARCIEESLLGVEPVYLRRLEAVQFQPWADSDDPIEAGAQAILNALRGDCHSHSDWSDGGSPIEEMAQTARELGHDYLVLTDHSPRLTVANGLSAERLEQQLDVVAELNVDLAPFRILTGIEVDILDEGALDQHEALLARLDLVVGSVHSKLRMPSEQMTPRMITAIANPHLDVLGHCTGRMVTGKRHRPESEFDAELIFAACAQFGVAVEINSRPERLDPPKRLLRLAIEAGCLVSIDTDAHAPGQLAWLAYGAERAARVCRPDRVDRQLLGPRGPAGLDRRPPRSSTRLDGIARPVSRVEPGMNTDVRLAEDRLRTKIAWLDSKHSFSFGSSYERGNTHHGLLLVNNDDTVAAGSGFETHPHRDMEIVTWVLDGSLVHQDSEGHHGLLYPGLAQRMSAGTGILHSEKNDAAGVDRPVHFVQMWVLPDERGIAPGYEQLDVGEALAGGGLVPVASGLAKHRNDTAIRISQRAAGLYAARLGQRSIGEPARGAVRPPLRGPGCGGPGGCGGNERRGHGAHHRQRRSSGHGPGTGRGPGLGDARRRRRLELIGQDQASPPTMPTPAARTSLS